MTRSVRSPRMPVTLRTLVIAALLALVPPPALSADRAPVDAATRQVERGANQIGQGKVIEGAGEAAKGIGNTVMEGAKYTGQRLEEAGKAAAPEAKTAWERTKEGAVAFGSSVREFFESLFR